MEGAFCCSADERLNYISIAVFVYGHGDIWACKKFFSPMNRYLWHKQVGVTHVHSFGTHTLVNVWYLHV